MKNKNTINNNQNHYIKIKKFEAFLGNKCNMEMVRKYDSDEGHTYELFCYDPMGINAFENGLLFFNRNEDLKPNVIIKSRNIKEAFKYPSKYSVEINHIDPNIKKYLKKIGFGVIRYTERKRKDGTIGVIMYISQGNKTKQVTFS